MPKPNQTTMTRNPPRTNVMRTLNQRLGKTTRVVGILFLVACLTFLLLSLWSPNVVFQVDSVASFLAAMILLFRDPKSRVQTRVLDALMMSSDRSIAQLSAQSGSSFTYLPEGKSVSDVVVVGTRSDFGDGQGKAPNAAKLVPPGRALAELFVRESGAKNLSIDVLKNATEPILTDGFGLADSVLLDVTQEHAIVSLDQPSTRCNAGGESSTGVIGCPVASFLAVLFARATGRPVTLDRCELDEAGESWKIKMEFGKA